LVGNYIGLFAVIGMWALSRAVSYGYAGPAAALTNVQTIVQTTLAALFLNQIPSQMEIIGVVCGLFGSCVISAGPTIAKSFASGNIGSRKNPQEYYLSDEGKVKSV
jgi:drug/metabolite transporter (DMT)-like permease